MNWEDIQVLVHDAGVDVVWHPDEKPPRLTVRPGQTFESAVRAVGRAIPELHPDDVGALVRKHVPDLVLRDVPPPEPEPTTPAAACEAPEPGREGMPVRRQVLAILTVTVVSGLLFAGAWDIAAEQAAPTAVSAGDPAGDISDWIQLQMAAELSCRPLGAGWGSCTTPDGTEITSQRVIGAGRAAWRFTWPDGNHVTCQIFDDEAAARVFGVARDREASPHVGQAGAWVVAGTDRRLVDAWVGRLGQPAHPRIED